jgi:hypothetical protein
MHCCAAARLEGLVVALLEPPAQQTPASAGAAGTRHPTRGGAPRQQKQSQGFPDSGSPFAVNERCDVRFLQLASALTVAQHDRCNVEALLGLSHGGPPAVTAYIVHRML